MRYLQSMLTPLKQHTALFLFAVLMTTLVIPVCGNILADFVDPFLSFLLPLFGCYLAAALAYALSKVRLAWLVWVLVVIICGGELLCIFCYHSFYSVHVVELLLETNPKESTEFLSSISTQASTWWSLFITFATLFFSILLAKVTERIPNWKHVPACLIGLLILWSGIRQISSYTKLVKCFGADSTMLISEERNMPHFNTPMVRLLYGYAYNRVSTKELSKLAESCKGAQVESCTFKSPLIIMIMGESYNKYHSPLYNPSYLPTTPRLSALEKDSLLVPFYDVISPSNLTSTVMRHVFSMWDSQCQDDWSEYSLFPVLFRKAGYQVAFLTNQFALKTNNLWNAVGGTIFNSPELSDIQFDVRNKEQYEYDMQMLKELPSTEFYDKPTLLIVHLYGQHVEYDKRYPSEEAPFKAEDERTPFGGQRGREMAAHYDNATAYNDKVVDAIFNLFKDRDAIGIYLSDHGEEVFDWRDKFERTSGKEMTTEIARYQYEVPFMFYLSPAYRQHHPDVDESIRAAQHIPYITERLPHTLLQLAGIKCKEYDERKDILSPRYNRHAKRIIRHDVDYDELMKSK